MLNTMLRNLNLVISEQYFLLSADWDISKGLLIELSIEYKNQFFKFE